MWGCLDRQLAKGSKYSNCESYRANKAIQTKSDPSDPQTASISSLAAASMQHPSSLPPFFAPVPTFSSPGQRDACHVRYLASTRAPGLQERNSSKSPVWRDSVGPNISETHGPRLTSHLNSSKTFENRRLRVLSSFHHWITIPSKKTLW